MDELNEHKTKMSEVLTKHEVKMAEKMVGLVNCNNLLQAARDQNLLLQQEIDELRSGRAGNSNMDEMFINDYDLNIPSGMLNKFDDDYNRYGGRRGSETLIENKRKASIEETIEEEEPDPTPSQPEEVVVEEDDEESSEIDVESFI